MAIKEKFRAECLRTAVCVGQWLPASETFIHEQLKHQIRTQARVIARDRTPYAVRFPYEDVVNLGRLEQVAFYHLGFAPTVRKALVSHGTQLVHAHFGINGTMMLPFARALRLPLVVSFHGHDVGGLEPQNRGTLRYRRYQRLAPELFSYGSLFLCASEQLRTLLIDHGAPESKAVLHHLGVDVDRFCPALPGTRSNSTVLMVGRLVEKKGMADGLRAFAKIVSLHPGARLVIVGEGPLGQELRHQVSDMGLLGRVDFKGALSGDDVLKEMQKATVLLTPSLTTAAGDRESGVIVVKEAGATGLPAVVTRHGGLPEIIDEGQNGFLVPERDVDKLADRLDRLLSSSDLRHTMGARARALVEQRYDSKQRNEILEEHLWRVYRQQSGTTMGEVPVRSNPAAAH